MSTLTVLRWNPTIQDYEQEEIEVSPGAMIILPGDSYKPEVLRVRTKSSCNVRNSPSTDPSSDVGDLTASKVIVATRHGDYFKCTLYVHKSVLEVLS